MALMEAIRRDTPRPHPSARSRPTRATLIGLQMGTGLAMIPVMRPPVGTITITIGVETHVGDASGPPDARPSRAPDGGR
jgi:hypothetical protein